MPPVPPGPEAPPPAPRTDRVRVRGLDHAIHCWGETGAPPLVLLHGWADTGRSFAFMADRLAADWQVLAPDWRGFGDSGRAPAGYWFPDYLADLDAILDHYSPHTPVALLGHSMGGNVACLYAGTRPGRLRALVTMEGFGLPPRPASEAPARYRQWLDELREEPTLRGFASLDALADYLRGRDPHLDPARARYVAEAWSRPGQGGERVLKADPGHKRINPVLYRHEEFLACIAAIEAPVMLVLGRESWAFERYRDETVRAELDAVLPQRRVEVVEGAGHMLHHDRPAEVSALVADFLSEPSR